MCVFGNVLCICGSEKRYVVGGGKEFIESRAYLPRKALDAGEITAQKISVDKKLHHRLLENTSQYIVRTVLPANRRTKYYSAARTQFFGSKRLSWI